MQIRVKIFAGVQTLLGGDELCLELPEGANVALLRQHLCQLHPALQRWPRLQIAVDRQYAPDDCVLREESEVACIPPVSGG